MKSFWIKTQKVLNSCLSTGLVQEPNNLLPSVFIEWCYSVCNWSPKHFSYLYFSYRLQAIVPVFALCPSEVTNWKNGFIFSHFGMVLSTLTTMAGDVDVLISKNEEKRIRKKVYGKNTNNAAVIPFNQSCIDWQPSKAVQRHSITNVMHYVIELQLQ